MVRVDELVRGGLDLRQDAEPCERIHTLEQSQHVWRHARSRDAVEAVAAGDEVAFEHLLRPAGAEAHARPVRVDAVYRHLIHLEQQRTA